MRRCSAFALQRVGEKLPTHRSNRRRPPPRWSLRQRDRGVFKASPIPHSRQDLPQSGQRGSRRGFCVLGLNPLRRYGDGTDQRRVASTGTCSAVLHAASIAALTARSSGRKWDPVRALTQPLWAGRGCKRRSSPAARRGNAHGPDLLALQLFFSLSLLSLPFPVLSAGAGLPERVPVAPSVGRSNAATNEGVKVHVPRGKTPLVEY